MKKLIVINLQVEGVHHWPGCDIKEVSFLKHPHRHIFHITAKKEVAHNDRDIEIIKLKREIIGWLGFVYSSVEFKCINFQALSCEDIAEGLIKKFKLNYCQVLEDNENGAEIWA